jgi:hypothetical protein
VVSHRSPFCAFLLLDHGRTFVDHLRLLSPWVRHLDARADAMEDGQSLEGATIASEGLAGIPIFLDEGIAGCTWVHPIEERCALAAMPVGHCGGWSGAASGPDPLSAPDRDHR